MFESTLMNLLFAFASVSAGVLAGIYGIFSNTVMPALAASPDKTAVRVMQDINRLIVNPLFLLFFMGSALASIALLIVAGLTGQLTWLTAIASVMLSATLFTTIGINVPLNNALKETTLDSTTRDGTNPPTLWQHYLDRWVHWNHIRAILCALSAFLYALAASGI